MIQKETLVVISFSSCKNNNPITIQLHYITVVMRQSELSDNQHYAEGFGLKCLCIKYCSLYVALIYTRIFVVLCINFEVLARMHDNSQKRLECMYLYIHVHWCGVVVTEIDNC